MGLFGIANAVLALDAPMVDLHVYRAAGEAVSAGRELYSEPVWRDFLFTYPPFAALVFVPLALVESGAVEVGAVVLNCALLVLVVERSWRSLGVRNPQRHVPAVIATAGAAFLIEAVHTNFHDGQINLLLLALVLTDLTGRQGGRLRGAGIGVAAGLKLTPLVFLVVLPVLGRRRHAVRAAAWAVGTALLGALVLPGPSSAYWLSGAFADTSRIFPDPTSRHNQSLRGMLLKSGVPEPGATWAWLVLAALMGVVVLALASAEPREPLLVASLIGLYTTAVSPWAWGHHWVWVVPLGVFLASVMGDADRRRTWLPSTVLLAGTAPWVLALADPQGDGEVPVLSGGPLAFVLGNFYVLFFVAVLCTAVRDHRERCSSHPCRALGRRRAGD
ncbi:glycosyltransferase 87 family protein [Actinokineospora spheciospongiae]|uniref:glycosyltransferase 87 family protein n=1 Tax=Actinokineospora spheciospongiae TaxID=909613 RepID=UPI000D848DE2|nr:glycosyltransferase 87 family protein [Actinokineospora spheciospongiae]PWW60356.1 alpha-1,2-mannosyltransferase [Actinokineospora spheciospongiae]